MGPLFEKYRKLVEQVRQEHITANAIVSGHDFYHACRVAAFCPKIAEDERVGELAFVGALIHNSDHLIKGFVEEVSEKTVKVYLHDCLVLFTPELSPREVASIVEAVWEHNKRNSDKDSPITVCLKDADKLANLDLDLAIRSGRHLARLPIFDPRYVFLKDPSATYRNPKTILRDIESSLEWQEPGWFRLPEAIELAKKRFAALRNFLRTLQEQLHEEGMVDPIFPESLITEPTAAP